MKKLLLTALAAVLLISACNKAKTTGHLRVYVDMSHPITALAVPDSLKHTIAGGSLVSATDTTHLQITSAGDNSGNRTQKILDFGELQPGSYLVDSIHGYAYGDSVYVTLGANISTPVFTIKAGQDQNQHVAF